MKTRSKTIAGLFSACAIAGAFSVSNVLADKEGKDHEHKNEKTEKKEHDHDHDHSKKKAGPNGGRLITSVEPHAEFLITKDRKVMITFVDDHNKVVAAPEGGVVKVTGGSRSKPTRLKFSAEGKSLISNLALPKGKAIPVIVQIKTSAKGKYTLDKFNLDMSKCPGCPYLEYACICDHDHDGHDHDDKDHKHEKK